MRHPLGSVLICLGVIGAVAVVVGFYPDELAEKKDPGFVDNIFASRLIVFVARLTLVATAAYVIASMAALTWGRRWLTQVGPGGVKAAEISESVGSYEAENRVLSRDLADAREAIDRLRERLQESDSALQARLADIEFLVRRIDMLQNEPEEGSSQ